MSAPPRSLAAHLVPRLIAIALLVFGAVALLLLWHARSALDEALEQGQRSRIAALAALLEVDVDGLELEADPRALPEYRGQDADAFFVIVDVEHGELVAASDRAREVLDAASDAALVERVEAAAGGPGAVLEAGARRYALRATRVWIAPEVEDDDLDPDEWLERLVARAPPPDWTAGQHVAIAVGVALDEREARLTEAVWVTTATLLVGLLVLVALAWATVRASLRPLRALEARVTAMEPAQLRPLGVATTVSEVAALGGALDGLIERLDAALRRERRFMADVAHELRTPLAELRALAEVALRTSPARAGHRAELEEVAQTAAQMGRTLETLAALARRDAGEHLAGSRESVSLEALVERTLAAAAPRLGERGLTLVRELETGVRVETDAEALRTVVANLVDNAVAYAPAGSTVRVRLATEAEGFVLELSNPAPQLEPEDVERLFEPFWRKDTARSDRQHSGLGLALCASLSHALGLELAARLDAGVLGVTLRSGDAAARKSAAVISP